jgi:hypothetical protein
MDSRIHVRLRGWVLRVLRYRGFAGQVQALMAGEFKQKLGAVRASVFSVNTA